MERGEQRDGTPTGTPVGPRYRALKRNLRWGQSQQPSAPGALLEPEPVHRLHVLVGKHQEEFWRPVVFSIGQVSCLNGQLADQLAVRGIQADLDRRARRRAG